MVECQLVTIGRKMKGWWPSGDQHSRHWQARDTHGATAIKWDFCKKQDISIISASVWKYLLDSTGNNMVTFILKDEGRHGAQVLCWWGWSDTWGAHRWLPGSQPWDGYVRGSDKTPDPIREFWGMKDPFPFHLLSSKGRKRLKTLWDQRSLKLKDN